MKRITTLVYKGHSYEIVYSQEHYCAIDHEDIDSNGNLIRPLNGLQMFANKNCNDCINGVKFYIDIMETYGSVDNYIKTMYNA